MIPGRGASVERRAACGARCRCTVLFAKGLEEEVLSKVATVTVGTRPGDATVQDSSDVYYMYLLYWAGLESQMA
eukprot:750499-Hanusia_phi.AAC.6